MPKPSSAPSAPPRNKLSAAQHAMHGLGLRRDIDLALHLPIRYEDETRITPLHLAREGEVVQIEAVVLSSETQYRPRRQLVAKVQDGDLICQLRFFTFYPSTQKQLQTGETVRLRGEVKRSLMGLSMIHPTVKPVSEPLPLTLTPVYSTVAALPQSYLRKAIANALKRADLGETLQASPPPTPLWPLSQGLDFLHHPQSGVPLATLQDPQHPAWQRLKAEELLAQQLSQWRSRLEREQRRAPVLTLPEPSPTHPPLTQALLVRLPFSLTAAQTRVVQEIGDDLQKPVPMHRLLQGDVGSGKTVVAAMAAAQCMANGYQCALMAPTEILAQQHFQKLVAWLEPLGITVAWLTGSLKAKEKRDMLALAASGKAQLVVGTHAVISEKVSLPRLGLAIIDEQHRFGVAQRLALRAKLQPDDAKDVRGNPSPSAHIEPHLLMMSATPIPRTLAMSYYADLNVSTIDELPPGRSPIVTRVLHENRRDDVISRIQAQIDAGRQVYWVCPLIEESEAIDLRNATDTYEELSALLGDRVGLLHSRMAVADKKAIMQAFVVGTLSVLVSTTVIEVGVDVPNASLMVIEHAERFGLSQLHQLRGRVGRGSAASACVLLYCTGDAPRLGEKARARLNAMQQTQDGFEIARRDLDIRGPGEFMGERQSGAALLRFADLEADQALLKWARDLAPRMWAQTPHLASRHVERWLGGKAEFLKA
jgi:ATP-dependent DNA helicase RecG